MTALLLLATLVAVPDGAKIVDEMPSDFWRSPKRCGQNCLYAYLKLNNKPASLAAISETTTADARGMSLSELKKSANDLGVPSRAIRGDSLTLESIGLPAIAHMNTHQGHYVVLLRIDDDSISMIDMVSGQVEKLPRARFLERWSGFLIVRTEPGFGQYVGRKTIFLGLASIGMATLSLGLLFLNRKKHDAM